MPTATYLRDWFPSHKTRDMAPRFLVYMDGGEIGAPPPAPIPTYSEKLLSLFGSSIIGHWKQAELSGTASLDSGPNNNPGVYTDVFLGKAGIGDGLTSALYDGATSFNNIYSVGLAADFNPLEGMLELWAKVSAAGVWTDGILRRLAYISVDANNRVAISKLTTNNTLDLRYVAGGTSKIITIPALTSVDWLHLVITWSVTADQVKAYINGVQVEPTLTGLGTWAGALSATGVNLGSQAAASGSSIWSGYEAHAVLLNRAATAAEVLASSVIPPYTPPAPSGPISLAGFNTDTQNETHGVRLFGAGQYCLTPDWHADKIDCWDISDPANPEIISTATGIGEPLYVTVAPGEQHAYCIGAPESGPYKFWSIDISDPEDITIVGSVTDNGFNGQEVVIYGDYAFCAGIYVSPAQITVVDISDPLNPTVAGSIAGDGAPNFLFHVLHMELSTDGQTLFAACGGENRLASFDVSDPPNISLIQTISDAHMDDTHEIWYDDGYLYVANIGLDDVGNGGILVFDVSDPADMTFVAQVKKSDETAFTYYFDHVHGLFLEGNYLYACSNQGTALSKFDVSDPENPSVVWSYSDPIYLNGAHEVAKHGDYLFVAAWGLPGLVVYREL